MKAKWLDRRLIVNPLYFTICTSEAIFKKELKRLGCSIDLGVSRGSDGTTHHLQNQRGDSVAVVCVYDHKRGTEEIYALLVHEAVHIWQEIKFLIGEKDPSHEFEAYAIQQISQQLFYEYKRQRKGSRK